MKPAPAVERVRAMADRLGAAHAGFEDSGPVCVHLDDAPWMTARRVKIALKYKRCPLCFWSLVKSFGLTPAETVEGFAA